MFNLPKNVISVFGLAETDSDQSQSGKSYASVRLILLSLFFFSGATGLIYQIVWNRMLTLVFGSTVFAVTTVLTAFMAGMALGSFYFGRFIDKRGEPLKIYALMQLGIGIFALLLPFILDAVSLIYIPIHRNLQTSFYLLSLVKFILCFIVIIIPTTLMGGTLPVVSKFFTNRLGRLGWNIGLLYAVNTFGAVLGCFSAGFILIRGVGVSGTIYIAASINIVIALLSLYLYSRTGKISRDEVVTEEVQQPSDLPEWSGKLALVVIAVSGFCGLAYEVLWTRVLTLFLGSTTYAFTTMLSAFLCGIAMGSFILARFVDKRKNLFAILGVIQICIGLSAVLLVPVFGKLYSIGTSFVKPGWWNFISSRFTLSFLVMLVPTMLMGATFPLVVKIYSRSFRHLGQSIGNVYSINTLGSIFGSFMTGFVFIPLIGIQRSIIIIAFLNAAAGTVVSILSATYSSSLMNQERHSSNMIYIIPPSVAILIMALVSIFIDMEKPLTEYTSIFKGTGIANKMLFYEEDIDASVTVVEDTQNVRRAFVDANQAAEDSRWDLPSHSVIGHLPILLHPEPENALVIGFGMGVTSWSISRHGVEVDAVEISPGMIKANKYFTKINNNVLDEPLVNLYLDDGRNFALTTDKKYDMISTGIIHPLVSANSAGFYTIDFYDICKRILSEDGIMCQWVPLHRVPEEHYRMIVRTFKSAFPHTTLWFKYTPDFVILIGMPKKLKIDYMDFKNRMSKPGVKEDLALVNMDDPVAFLDSFMMDEDNVEQYAGDGPLHTDNRPRMEFFGTTMGNTTIQNIRGMMPYRESVLPFLTNLGSNANEIKEQLKNAYQATEYVIAGQIFYVTGDFENSIRQYRMALDMNPQDENARWLMSYVENVLDEEALDEYKEIVEVQPDSATAHTGLGLLYEKQGDLDKAVEEFKTAIQLDPTIAVARINLGAIYMKMGMIDEAIEQYEALVNTEAGSAVIHGRLGDLYRAKGDYTRAEQQFQKALELDFEMHLAHYSLASLYMEQGIKLDKALEHARKAVEINSSPKFVALLAVLYYEKGMYSEARREIKRALETEPDNERYKAILSEIENKLER
ncbi:tetratricopeptide repeat protein [Candidatus Poribacteria bacterium]|nr:tetratricopeptide repeat protein [Candidatus Poribacteria bacterium]